MRRTLPLPSRRLPLSDGAVMGSSRLPGRGSFILTQQATLALFLLCGERRLGTRLQLSSDGARANPPGRGSRAPGGGRVSGPLEQGPETHLGWPRVHTTPSRVRRPAPTAQGVTTPPPLQSPGSPAGAVLAHGPSIPTWTSVDPRPLAPSSSGLRGRRSAADWGWCEKSEVLSPGDLLGGRAVLLDHLGPIRKPEPWVQPDSECWAWKDRFPASSEMSGGPCQIPGRNPQASLPPGCFLPDCSWDRRLPGPLPADNRHPAWEKPRNEQGLSTSKEACLGYLM